MLILQVLLEGAERSKVTGQMPAGPGESGLFLFQANMIGTAIKLCFPPPWAGRKPSAKPKMVKSTNAKIIITG